MNKCTVKSVLMPAIIVSVLCVLSSMAMASEFYADMTRSVPSQNGMITMKGRIYVKGVLQRQEVSTKAGKHIVIMRPDKGVIWTLMPDKKTYMEQPTAKIDIKSVPSIESSMKKLGNFKKNGIAKVAGYDCVKYTYKDSKRQMTGTVYISSRLQQQLKADTQTRMGKMSYLLSNIKEGKQPTSLFDIPKGYKKVAMPAMGGMGKTTPGMGKGKVMPTMPPSHGQ
ncbi:MAG: DUF4412 domain-containing protein [Armatimonadota bacterium]